MKVYMKFVVWNKHFAVGVALCELLLHSVMHSASEEHSQSEPQWWSFIGLA